MMISEIFNHSDMEVMKRIFYKDIMNKIYDITTRMGDDWSSLKIINNESICSVLESCKKVNDFHSLYIDIVREDIFLFAKKTLNNEDSFSELHRIKFNNGVILNYIDFGEYYLLDDDISWGLSKHYEKGDSGKGLISTVVENQFLGCFEKWLIDHFWFDFLSIPFEEKLGTITIHHDCVIENDSLIRWNNKNFRWERKKIQKYTYRKNLWIDKTEEEKVVGMEEEKVVGMEEVKFENKKDFDNELKSKKIPVLVLFGASWCNQCKVMQKILTSHDWENDRFLFWKVDVDDENINFVSELGISSLPEICIFEKGKLVWDRTGVVKIDEIEKALRKE